MEKRPNYLPASYIQFTTPQHPSEPPSACFVFESWKTATACYNILLESYDDNQATIRFNEVTDFIIDLDILSVKNGKWVTGCRTSFSKKTYQEFIDYVNPDDVYMVLFGYFEKKDKFIVCGSSTMPKRVITFLGYSSKVES